MNTAFSFLSIDSDVLGMSLTFNVDENSSSRALKLNHDKRRLITGLFGIRKVNGRNRLLGSEVKRTNVLFVSRVFAFTSNQDLSQSSIMRRKVIRELIVWFGNPAEDLSRQVLVNWAIKEALTTNLVNLE